MISAKHIPSCNTATGKWDSTKKQSRNFELESSLDDDDSGRCMDIVPYRYQQHNNGKAASHGSKHVHSYEDVHWRRSKESTTSISRSRTFSLTSTPYHSDGLPTTAPRHRPAGCRHPVRRRSTAARAPLPSCAPRDAAPRATTAGLRSAAVLCAEPHGTRTTRLGRAPRPGAAAALRRPRPTAGIRLGPMGRDEQEVKIRQGAILACVLGF